MSSPRIPARPEDCVDSSRALECRLNVSALSNPHALYVFLSSPDLSDFINSVKTLIDSGSTQCFIDSKFAHLHCSPYSINLITLRLFDGSSNSIISEAVDVTLCFPSRESFPTSLFVTQLDSSCSLVLGHNWLTQHNPLIDWVKSSIAFRTIPTNASAAQVEDVPESPPESLRSASPETPNIPEPSEPIKPPSISLIGAAAFARACKLPRSQSFQICLSDPSVSAKATSTSEIPDNPVDLSSVPEDYHNFPDVFNKAKADTLAPHRPYDLKIQLQDGAQPPVGPIYSVSPSELQSLRDFIDEHLNIGFI